jgi:hypothetical protein
VWGLRPPVVKIIIECSQEIHTSGTRPLYLVWFVLDTTAFPPHNPPCLLLWARGEQEFTRCDHWGARCNICRGGPCSASIKNVPRGGTGCGRISPAPTRAWSFVPVAEVPCGRYHRRSVRAFGCGRVRWLRVRCGPGHDRF